MQHNSPLHFYAQGKLLLTGEYTVLDGATALAIPTRYGQSLTVRSVEKKGCLWKSLDSDGTVWFEATFSNKGQILTCQKDQRHIAQTLVNILETAQELQPNFKPYDKLEVEMLLEFPRNWGLGTSSTLLYNIAQWADVDAVRLLQKSFGGSGYDVAVAQYKAPLLYRLAEGQPIVQTINLSWPFKDKLFFVHLNEKQDSKEGIALYKKALQQVKAPVAQISELTLQIVNCTQFETCMELFQQHENLLSKLLGLPTVKTRLFSDFNGVVKSLGAWGGDFVLVGGGIEAQDYFHHKGYETIVPFSEMIREDK